MKNIAILFFLFQLYSCSFTSPDYNADNLGKEGIVLRTWRIIGPICTTEKKPALFTDCLKAYGKSEQSLSYADLGMIHPLNAKQRFENRKVDSSGLEGLSVDFNEVLNITQPDSIKGVAYAGCTIRSSQKQDLKLNFACTGGTVIWLNNKQIFANEHGTDLNIYENYIDLPLQPGENFLLVKTIKPGNRWELFAAIEKNSKESMIRHKRNFALQFGNEYLARNIIENDTIKLAYGIWDNNFKLEIEGVNAKWNIKANQSINIANLPDGFYNTKLYAREDTFTNRFYKTNNFDLAYRRLTDSISMLLSKKANPIFNALIDRHNILMNPENYPKRDYQKKSWDKRMLFVFDNLLIQYNILKKRITAADAKGCLLRAYTSKIDNATQYYILHVPSGYKKGQPIPLVVEIAKLMKWFPSVLETNRFANIRLMELFDDLANKYNFIVIEPGNRTVDKPNYNGIDEVDLLEALEDVKKTYTIDTSRVYLRGSCRAAYDAMKLAVNYPDKFAGLGIISPEFPTSSGDKYSLLEKNDPLHYLGNIKDLPFYDIHSLIDTHSTIQASERLNVVANRAGLKDFHYRKLLLEFKPYYSEEYLDDIFSFFSSLPVRTKKTDNYKRCQAAGPFAHIFLDPFIVVSGTIGNAQDLHQIKKTITLLNEDWKRRYYANLVIKTDKEVSAEEINNSNLLLVGSPASNLILKKWASKLPLKVDKAFVSIGSQRMEGQLNYYLIYPNPGNIKKYVGVIGYNDPLFFELSSEGAPPAPFNDISNYGWYDYKIWKNDGKSVFGYFDNK